MHDANRRKLLVGAGAIAASAMLPKFAFAAPEYRLKFANIMPDNHPLNTRMGEARDRILKETGGKVEIQIFPNSQLGTDADMLSQVRSGAIDFFASSGLIVATLVPAASINGIGFAFQDYDHVWKAMDGDVGKYVINEFAKSNLVAFDKMWDNGFRQTTSSSKMVKSPADMAGFKIRVPPSPLWTSLFKSLGAAPTSIPWGETYSALQTHVADGLENPLAGIYFAKMYEVQKYLFKTNHMWDGFWFLANKRSWERMPEPLRAVITKNVNQSALQQRADVEKLNGALTSDLSKKGLQFFDVSPAPFREKLAQSGFYKEWKGKMGNDLWARLEAVTGPLG
ncbi:TRAP transporter substrate-binding protein [Paraburkholderia phenoliruptrix]|uniref:TRAP transporter substrate-binding protein n=1 Tax=Paraburkholderia phenoliruptrix TaxID=252970 RepID=UPI002869BA0F|nr:TRAP transporter substrate-binding protein [Paraburkholderia phenoliruptrix]WMY11775.1 TRAP transporter substrate-binding protein [Paraburkholderia phenoliruptrix]